jgi:uncharacterized membrane protein YdcZ (DUF606 family)
MILLPGAAVVIIVITGLAGVALCAVLAFMVGELALHVSAALVHHTKAWQRQVSGAKDADRWWLDTKGWAGASMLGSLVVFIYTFVGPYFAFIKYIRGI